ncbi:branched-chain amino acid transport protein [Burkholderia cenocepacia]|nr:branched-chain amino acid transport protein [Burkholderia cenocepacia]
MSATEIWIVIVGMTIVTAVTRALFLIGGERTVLPERAQRALRYAPAAALVAVVLPDVLETPAGLSFALSNHPFYAALAGLGWVFVAAQHARYDRRRNARLHRVAPDLLMGRRSGSPGAARLRRRIAALRQYVGSGPRSQIGGIRRRTGQSAGWIG